MGHVEMRARVEAPIERVFDYAADIWRTAEWVVPVVAFRTDAPITKVGDRFSGKLKDLGRVLEAEGVVTAFERPRLLALGISADGGHQTWTFRFVPAGTGTDVEMSIDYDVALSGGAEIADAQFLERTMRRSLEQSGDSFVAIVEHRGFRAAAN